ncbi:hypothetical protein EB241_08810 [Erwinia psidii]|uniref:Uncharacterized protein n=1 Tax=Erwinia psidii TaxID=69224 RepID=A0A3N6V118_9GAMM|nr:hypothetical protein EB241_08810 [Erwinia psidii]
MVFFQQGVPLLRWASQRMVNASEKDEKPAASPSQEKNRWLLCVINHIAGQIVDAVREVFHHGRWVYLAARK